MSIHAGQLVETVVRAAALVAFVAALLILITQWAVRRGTLTPFGWWPRFVRGWSDPVLRPVERRVRAGGGNPQDAPLWLLGGVVVAGLLAMTAVRWVAGVVALLDSMRDANARAWLHLAVATATSLLSFAIIVRVVAGWLGAGRYHKWIRPAYLLTDWLIEPIRRRLPPFGPLDLSPLLAYVLVLLFRSFLLSVV